MNKEYLGDSVYIEMTNWGEFILTTENGLPTDPSNRIFLEHEVTNRLLDYIKRMKGTL